MQWNCVAAGAGPGEWGIVWQRSWGRMTASLNLGRNMSLTYDVSVADNALESIRFHDNYMAVLGIGVGEWAVENADDLAEKLSKAIEFARWHLDEYEALANRIHDNSTGASF